MIVSGINALFFHPSFPVTEVDPMRKTLSVLLTVSILFLCCFTPAYAETADSGNIFLYGESHADPSCLEKELAAWADCYASGMRDLFIELPYYSAEYLNLWMRSDTDELLEFFYDAMEGTQSHDPCVLDFYRKIKSGFPDTVFHGTDVGHQFNTLGAAYLTLLEYGGNAMINPELKYAVMSDIILLSLVGIKVVLVHGGGPEISGMLKKLGIESKFVNGLRYTDKDTAEVVQMVLSGKTNKDLVSLIETEGGKAVGLCGIDG